MTIIVMIDSKNKSYKLFFKIMKVWGC